MKYDEFVFDGTYGRLYEDGDITIGGKISAHLYDDGEIWVDHKKYAKIYDDGSIYKDGREVGRIFSNGEIWGKLNQHGKVYRDNSTTSSKRQETWKPKEESTFSDKRKTSSSQTRTMPETPGCSMTSLVAVFVIGVLIYAIIGFAKTYWTDFIFSEPERYADSMFGFVVGFLALIVPVGIGVKKQVAESCKDKLKAFDSYKLGVVYAGIGGIVGIFLADILLNHFGLILGVAIWFTEYSAGMKVWSLVYGLFCLAIGLPLIGIAIGLVPAAIGVIIYKVIG